MTKTKRITSVNEPKYFTNLHGHSGFSLGDGLNNPKEHIDFALENGSDSLALTDHGNMNGFSHQYLHAEELNKKGIDFKAIFGVEAYFISSIKDWHHLYETEAIRKKEEKSNKKTSKKKSDSSSAYAQTENDAEEIGDALKEKADEDLEGSSTIEDEEESKSNKVKNPLYQRSHLVLLAKNDAGLKTLFKCISKSFKDGFYKYPRMDFDMLKENSNGNIIATSACIAGNLAKIVFDNQDKNSLPEKFINLEPNKYNFDKIQNELASLVGRFQETFGMENYYIELQFNSLNVQHLVNMHLIECSKRTGAPLVVTCDSHYANPKYWKEREIYKLMAQMGIMKKTPEELSFQIPQKIEELKCELYPKNVKQLWETYLNTTGEYDFYDDEQIRNAIQLTHSIAHDQIGDIKIDRKVKLPAINKIIEKTRLEELISEIDDTTSSSDEDYIAFQQLKKDAIEGAKWRKIHDKPEYIERLKEELSVIKKLKFSKYFLTYAKIMNLASKEMLTGNSRGSGGGCLLAYVLDITQIDPIKNGLLFERFLTLSKKGWPDIDTDFSDRIRALNLISECFGEENVVPVSNFNQLQLRSLIKDVSKLQGLPFEEINNYTKCIEQEAMAEAKKEPGFDAQQWELTIEEAEENSPSFRELLHKYPEIEPNIRILFKQLKTTSRHAGGVIITDNAQENMPIIKSGGVLQTPWQEGVNFRHLEGFGFLKFDILGVGTLRILENCIRRILKKSGKEYVSFDDVKDFYYKELHPDNNPMTDIKVYKHVFWDNNYTGVFQFVQKNVQDFMAKMKPTSVLDLSVATSIYRPGPLSISADKLYLKNMENPDKVVYKHPLLKEVLGPTGGLVIFQEQLQLIYHKLAGVPLNQTDDIRKALLKKDKSNVEKTAKEQQRLRQDFIDRCLEVNQIPIEVSADIFDYMMKFVSYSFNKSHAVGYATTSYQCAHLLTYYPDEWIASYIDYCTNEKGTASGKDAPKDVALAEAKTFGYKLGKPDINLSSMEFDVGPDKTLIPSFSALKSVGAVAYQEALQYRPYKTLEDLLWNPDDTWRHSKLNKRAMTTLVKLEAFDSMGLVGENCEFKNYRQLHHILVDHSDELKRAISKKSKKHKEMLNAFITEAKELPDWDLSEKIKFSKELSGSVDTDLIITPEVKEYLGKAKIPSIDSWSNEKQLYWAIVQSAKLGTTKKGKPFCRITLIGESGESHQCFFWGFNPVKDKLIPENILIIGSFKKSDFGLSSFYSKIEILENKE